MADDWHTLTKLTGAATVVVERVRLAGSAVRIEGAFELPALARLSAEDQVFVAAFVRAHGSIKEMERLFGVSYPTIKNRLNRLAEQLQLVEMNVPPPAEDLLKQIEMGELSVSEALKLLKK